MSILQKRGRGASQGAGGRVDGCRAVSSGGGTGSRSSARLLLRCLLLSRLKWSRRQQSFTIVRHASSQRRKGLVTGRLGVRRLRARMDGLRKSESVRSLTMRLGGGETAASTVHTTLKGALV